MAQKKTVWLQAFCLFILLILTSACGVSQQEMPSLDEIISLAWMHPSGGAINQPPLIVADVVIVIPSGGPLLALDASTGKLRWQFDPPEGLWDRAYASDEKRIFVGLKGGTLAALNARDGKPLWERSLGINSQVPSLAFNDILYAPTTFVGPELKPDTQGRAKLFALETKTGNLVWEFESENYILQTPERRGDVVYLGGNFYDPREIDEGGHVRIYALDSKTASVKWTYEAEDGFPKRLYATDRTLNFVGYQDFMNGIDIASGDLRWRKDTGNWTPSFLGDKQTVYVSSANTSVMAYNADSGDLLWQYDIPEGSFNYVLGAPVIVSDTLYFLTQHGDIFALNAVDGTYQWHISTGVVAARTGLTIRDNWLYFGDADGSVYAHTTK